MFSLSKPLVFGHSAQEGTGSGSHFGMSQQELGLGSHGQAAPVTVGNSLQPQVDWLTIGRWSHGQAAITVLNEHVAIPTAIAAATVSFLIVILTSL
jgi:hypothetical protein